MVARAVTHDVDDGPHREFPPQRSIEMIPDILAITLTDAPCIADTLKYPELSHCSVICPSLISREEECGPLIRPLAVPASPVGLFPAHVSESGCSSSGARLSTATLPRMYMLYVSKYREGGGHLGGGEEKGKKNQHLQCY